MTGCRTFCEVHRKLTFLSVDYEQLQGRWGVVYPSHLRTDPQQHAVRYRLSTGGLHDLPMCIAARLHLRTRVPRNDIDGTSHRRFRNAHCAHLHTHGPPTTGCGEGLT